MKSLQEVELRLWQNQISWNLHDSELGQAERWASSWEMWLLDTIPLEKSSQTRRSREWIVWVDELVSWDNSWTEWRSSTPKAQET